MSGAQSRCIVCGLGPVEARDRCQACYRFLLRNGYDRPAGRVLDTVRARARGGYAALAARTDLAGVLDPT